ncbi:hypothetical protein I3760_14G033400 [Carya illinoinensis]|nr:hypothetical protein I3760_14G033400 [Carya illinoinensis]
MIMKQRCTRDAVLKLFGGEDQLRHDEESQMAREKEAMWHLDNLTICNMCYIENYTCDFEKYFYDLPIGTFDWYLKMYFHKLPGGIGYELEKEFQKRSVVIPNTLGGRIKFLKDWIAKECSKSSMIKQAKNTKGTALCCKKGDLRTPSQYGCRTTRSKPYKKKQNFSRKPKKRRYKFQKRPYKSYGKKDCKCWLCHQEGHFANECPNKKSFQQDDKRRKDLKILDLAYKMHLYPISSEVESDEELYFLKQNNQK